MDSGMSAGQAATPVRAAGRQPSPLPLEISDLSYAIDGVRLIDGLTLRLDAGGRTVVMGPNGAGKSLTLRLLQGLIEPTGGRIHHAGRPFDASLRRRVALVFQRPVLLRRSVAANLAHALAAHGVARAERPARIAELLVQAGLGDLARRPARVLSGGEQQRLALVRALAAEPAILLLDEPTASLDPHSTLAIERLIDQAHAAGTKIVLVTHDLGQARRLADDVAFLHRGRLTEHTPADRFFSAPQSDAARAYLDGRLLV